jgi:threonylcarbamoyladenosine tRNA methylthiotransferase MtaB
MKRKFFFIKTLGCKVNQYEAQGIRELLLDAGYSESDAPHDAEYIIINSCTVTQESDRKTFYYIRRFKKINPRAVIVLTGCATEKKSHASLHEKGADLIVTNQEKKSIAHRLNLYDSREFNSACQGDESLLSEDVYTDMTISNFKGHVRAFIKIQDGCNMNCSYCKVCIVRGKSRSRALGAIIHEAERLCDNGFKEIVLTGIQLGAFGKDYPVRENLVRLLCSLAAIKGIERIRLSSLEPFDVETDLIDYMATEKKICPHLHLPLQSGDNSVLRRMRRTYTHEKFFGLIEELKSKIVSFAFTTDVIVGFPGEDESAFRNTVRLLEATEPFKIHIFPFSPREGTAAALFDDKIDVHTIKEREKELLFLSQRLFEKSSRALIGKSLPILIEEVTKKSMIAKGRLSDYRQVEIINKGYAMNELVTVRIQEVAKGFLVGAPLE